MKPDPARAAQANNITAPTEMAITRAAELLRKGDVIGMPTETVYGLAGDGLNPEALARIFEVKQRPLFDPLILHFSDAAAAFDVVEQIPTAARELAQHFWPGPLTMVLPKTGLVPDLATSGLPNVAIRVPAHPVAQALLRAYGGGPLAAPSANRFGRISPTDALAVQAELGDAVPLILDGGPVRRGARVDGDLSFGATARAVTCGRRAARGNRGVDRQSAAWRTGRGTATRARAVETSLRAKETPAAGGRSGGNSVTHGCGLVGVWGSCGGFCGSS